MNIRNIPMKLVRDTQGVAMVEFAFVTPLLLLLILGGIEVANLMHAHLRVNQIAVTVADNAGRIDTAVDEANIHEVFAGAELIGERIDFKNSGRVVLSSLQENKQGGGNKGQMINWQRCWGDLSAQPAYGKEGRGRSDNSLKNGMGQRGNKIKSGNDVAVMFVEVTYDYQPIVGSGWIEPVQLRSEAAFNVRSRTVNNVSNSQGLKKLDCA